MWRWKYGEKENGKLYRIRWAKGNEIMCPATACPLIIVFHSWGSMFAECSGMWQDVWHFDTQCETGACLLDNRHYRRLSYSSNSFPSPYPPQICLLPASQPAPLRPFHLHHKKPNIEPHHLNHHICTTTNKFIHSFRISTIYPASTSHFTPK